MRVYTRQLSVLLVAVVFMTAAPCFLFANTSNWGATELEQLNSLCRQPTDSIVGCETDGASKVLSHRNLNTPVVFLHGFSPQTVGGQKLRVERYHYDKIPDAVATSADQDPFIVIPKGGEKARFFGESDGLISFISELHDRLCVSSESECASLDEWKNQMVLIAHSAGGTAALSQLVNSSLRPRTTIFLDGINSKASLEDAKKLVINFLNHALESVENNGLLLNVPRLFFYYTPSYDDLHSPIERVVKKWLDDHNRFIQAYPDLQKVVVMMPVKTSHGDLPRTVLLQDLHTMMK